MSPVINHKKKKNMKTQKNRIHEICVKLYRAGDDSSKEFIFKKKKDQGDGPVGTVLVLQG